MFVFHFIILYYPSFNPSQEEAMDMDAVIANSVE